MNTFWISAGIVWKDTKILIALAIGLLAPIKGLLIAVGIMIVIDTIFGVIAAKKQKKAITSNKLSGILSKMFVYQLIVIVAFALDKLILGEFTGLFVDINLLVTKVATLFIIGNELFSIDEKMRIIREGKGIWYEFKRLVGIAKLVKKETKSLEIDTDELIEKVKPKDTTNDEITTTEDDGNIG